MIGTLLNVLGILLGGACGIFLGHLMTETLQESIIKATGICVFVIGIAGAKEKGLFSLLFLFFCSRVRWLS